MFRTLVMAASMSLFAACALPCGFDASAGRCPSGCDVHRIFPIDPARQCRDEQHPVLECVEHVDFADAVVACVANRRTGELFESNEFGAGLLSSTFRPCTDGESEIAASSRLCE